MFKITGNHVVLTEDSRFGKAGADLGHIADVIVNNIAAIDPENPADSLVYRVARSCCEAHAAEVAALEAKHAAEIERLTNPQPDDEQAIELQARKRVARIQTEQLVEKRAEEILAGG